MAQSTCRVSAELQPACINGHFGQQWPLALIMILMQLMLTEMMIMVVIMADLTYSRRGEF